MKRNLITALMVIACFLLQCTVFHALAFNGIIPNLMIVLTASIGVMGGRKRGLLTGFFSGLLLDVFFGSTIGFYSLIYMYIGYINGCFRKIFYPEDIKLPLALIAASDLTCSLLTYFLLFLLRSRFAFGFYFTHIILPEIVYTMGVTLILYPLILKIDGRMAAKEQRSAKKFV